MSLGQSSRRYSLLVIVKFRILFQSNTFGILGRQRGSGTDIDQSSLGLPVSIIPPKCSMLIYFLPRFM
jgi:hypothetical protein